MLHVECKIKLTEQWEKTITRRWVALSLIGRYMFHMSAAQCCLTQTGSMKRADEIEEWSGSEEWDDLAGGEGGPVIQVPPRGGKPCLCSHASLSPPPLLVGLDLPRVGLSPPLYEGWLPHTALHNTAIYWQRQNAFLSGSKVWPLLWRHRAAGKPSKHLHF